jgi:hypothetical protein
MEDGQYRPVVRDYKAKGQIVDPLFDSGILLRGIWAALEIQNPRCRWFLAGRSLSLDVTQIDLETVNLMHASGDEFHLRATLAVERLMQERDRFVATMQEMAMVRGIVSADDVLASPSGLCGQWCPFLVLQFPFVQFLLTELLGGDHHASSMLVSSRGASHR